MPASTAARGRSIPTTGISGSGQALFFINVDGGNPANQPLDVDLDGIKDLCDNCPSVPNGPLLGSCITGSQIGNLCRSNQECDGGLCSFAQDDQDLDGEGNACVPEPGFVPGLVAGWDRPCSHSLGGGRL